MKCRVCKTPFERTRPLQVVCSISCAIQKSQDDAKKQRAKEATKSRQEAKKRLDAMSTIPQLKKDAQNAFNQFVRLRDQGKECISCSNVLGQSEVGGNYDCGHYRSTGSADHLRFNEDNAHGQCKHCNRWLAGNYANYRKGLISRIGFERVEKLETNEDYQKWTREGLLEIIKKYKTKIKEMKIGFGN